MIKKRIFLLLSLILLWALSARVYELSNIPSGVDWDEASNGYNGYAILKTGADEFNQKFPILFRGFEAYVPPVLIYLNSLAIALFGFTKFAIRLPNVLLGSLSVLGIYLLVSELTSKQKIALLAAFFLAVSPFSLVYSRVNTLASVPIVFVVFGTYFFIKSIRSPGYLFYSVISFLIGIFSYFSAYVFIPLYAFFLSLIFRSQLKFRHIIMFLAPLGVGTFLLLFVIPGGQSRLQGVSSLSDPNLIKLASQEAMREGTFGKILHNRRFVYAQKLLEGYFAPLQFSFLFSKSDSVGRMIVNGPGFGLLYWWDFLFLIAGAYFMFLRKVPGWKVVFLWFFLAPLPGAPTLPQPASTRLTLIIPAIIIIVAWGFWFLVKNRAKLIKLLAILLLSTNIFVFVHQYFIHFPQEKSHEWFYAYEPLFNFLNNEEHKNEKVFFVFRENDFLDQIHIFTAFYNRIDPKLYQESGGTRLGGFGTAGEFSVGRFYFVPEKCKDCGSTIAKSPFDLVVTSEKMLPEPLRVVRSLDTKEVLYIYPNNTVTVEDILKAYAAKR